METWGGLSIDEIIFHLKVPLEGTNMDVVIDGINRCVPIAVVMFLMMTAVLIGMKQKKKVTIICMFLIMSLSIGTTVKAAYHMYEELDVEKYLKNQKQESELIQKSYVDPRSVSITFPEKRRNLIYIYLESMESTYASKDAGGEFDENYIPELTDLARNNVSFSNSDKLGGAYTVTGSTWTMAAIFAQTLGLPLKLPENVNNQNEVLQDNNSLSTSAYNLEDILGENGYKQCFMIGSNASFGGRRSYFNSHSECEIWDIFTARESGKIPDDYDVWWGYEDIKLFEYAKEKLLQMQESEQPFHLTLLTADTHGEDGYVCELCEDEFGDNQYANVLACSSKRVSEFVQWVQEQPFYENTTIILTGDHLTMDSDFCEDLDYYDRRVYNAFINLPDGLDTSFEKTHYREFTTMDMFPTTVAALGAKIEKNKLGLGTNLFSNEKTLVEKYGIEELNQELMKKSVFYDLLINDIEY